METKKYELLKDDMIEINNYKLYCIRALRDFANIKKGDLGGYIEKEENLSDYGNCWVDTGATVYNNAKVCGNAEVYGNAKIYGNADIYENAKVCNNTEVYDYATVCGNAIVCNNAKIYDYANIYENAEVSGNSAISGHAEVYGDVGIYGSASVTIDAKVSSQKDIKVITNMGKHNTPITFFRTKDGDIRVIHNWFHGSLKEFRRKVRTEYDDEYKEEYLNTISYIKKIMK